MHIYKLFVLKLVAMWLAKSNFVTIMVHCYVMLKKELMTIMNRITDTDES